MQKRLLPSVLIASLLSLSLLTGCKKENGLGVDNDKVVKTPYSLYAGNDEGWLVNSTDGDNFQSVFPPDGYAPHLIITSGSNLLVLKENLHLSANNGKNFNPVYMQAKKFPWQTMAYNFPGHQRIYITSTKEKGVAFSDDNGLHWQEDMAWDNNLPSLEVSSFSGLGNNVLFAYSNESNVLLRKDNAGANWRRVQTSDFVPDPDGAFFLTSNNNTLFLVDHNNAGLAWYSENEGANWKQVQRGDLPQNRAIHCAATPLASGTSLLVGTDSMGVYRVENNRFVSAKIGLEQLTAVYSMAVKQNIYKNDVTLTFIFLATSTGIYRSEDRGLSWDRMTSGAFEGIYKAAY